MSEHRMEALRQLVRLGDGLPQEELLAKLAANYAAHDWPTSSATYNFVSSLRHQDQEQPDELFLLYQLERLDMILTLDLQPSSLPLIGPLLDRIRRMFHQLVLFYVNQVAARIATANMIQARLLRSAYENSVRSEQKPPRDEDMV